MTKLDRNRNRIFELLRFFTIEKTFSIFGFDPKV